MCVCVFFIIRPAFGYYDDLEVREVWRGSEPYQCFRIWADSSAGWMQAQDLADDAVAPIIRVLASRKRTRLGSFKQLVPRKHRSSF